MALQSRQCVADRVPSSAPVARESLVCCRLHGLWASSRPRTFRTVAVSPRGRQTKVRSAWACAGTAGSVGASASAAAIKIVRVMGDPLWVARCARGAILIRRRVRREVAERHHLASRQRGAGRMLAPRHCGPLFQRRSSIKTRPRGTDNAVVTVGKQVAARHGFRRARCVAVEQRLVDEHGGGPAVRLNSCVPV
jgi:hypothetical protein